MDMKRSESKRPSESFILGVIALVFLIIGYQTAMFVYKASLTRIAANRDHPDTVFVYQKTPAESGPRMRDRKVQSGRTAGEEKRYVRKNAEHSPHVEAIRENLPRNKVESFSFNPNTATLDDFCRLGFTPKQAQSILNYRAKGGRYRRKEDFSKSFVVSDSLYRRLEPYIDIPLLDLNLADSAAFDALPGIGGYFASKIVEYRRRLGGYSYKEQLMDIWKFDQQKYSALEDLITVNPETTTPYPLWTLPADSLHLHPYISNYETARAIVMFRENTPRENLTVDALIEAGILPPDSALKLSRCLIETSR